MCGFEGTKSSSIAQLVEHTAVNRVVVGSSPTRGAYENICDFNNSNNKYSGCKQDRLKWKISPCVCYYYISVCFIM